MPKERNDVNYFRNIWKSRNIITSLVRQDLRSKYRGSVLGMFWTVLIPLGITLIMATVYSILWESDITYFIPYLFSGLTPWNYITDSCLGGSNSYIAAEGYIKQLPIDIQIFPVRYALGSWISLLLGLLAYFVTTFFINSSMFTWYMLMAVPALFLFLLLGIVLSTLCSTAQVYLRDFTPMMSIILQGMFYVTPILYEYERMKDRGMSFIYEYNPFFYPIQMLRDALMGKPPAANTWGGTLVFLLCLLPLSLYVFKRTHTKISFKL